MLCVYVHQAPLEQEEGGVRRADAKELACTCSCSTVCFALNSDKINETEAA